MNRLALGLLLVVCFLTPLIGGQVFIGTQAFDGNLRGPALPFSAHSLLGLLIVSALVTLVCSRKVVPLPNPSVTLTVAVTMLSFGMAGAISSFKWVSWVHWLEWLTYALALFAVVAIVGRERGPRMVVTAIIIGCSLCALQGISEYSINRAVDPSWRIFASWVNPNALAGILLIGFILAMGLSVSEEDRIARFAAGAAAVAIGFALLLTQSKGGYVAATVGVATLVGLQLLFGAKKRVLVLIAPLLVLTILVFGIRSSPATQAGLARVEASSGTAEQSSGFRQLLWKGAIEIVKENPFGYGLGTYRYESARSGLTPQTQFTHQGFLQIAVETGVVGLLAWLTFAVAWFSTVFRGARRTSPQRSVRLAGIVAAVVGCATHNLLDSDWQTYGTGLIFFILLGVGVQLAADGSLPELLPKPARLTAIVVPSLIGLALLHSGAVEITKANAQAMLQRRDPNAARELSVARSLAPTDGEVYRLLAYASPESARESLQRATEFAPSTKNLRMLAQVLVQSGDQTGAAEALKQALKRDPNNLPSLLMLIELADADGNTQDLHRWFSRIEAVQSMPYFKVRALPELVPTEIAQASFIAAKHFPEQGDRLRIAALTTFAEYAKLTVPMIKGQLQAGGTEYAGETPAEATAKIGMARAEGERLLSVYRAGGRDTTELEGLLKALSPPDFSLPK